MNITKKQAASAFTQWEKDYRKNPSQFMSHQRRLKHRAATFGELCAVTLFQYLKNGKLAVLLFIMAASALSASAGNPPASSIIERDGHKLEVQFKTSIETNLPQNNWGSGKIVWGMPSARYYNYPLEEKPFPRVDESILTFEVTSNAYALYILDNRTTNIVATSSVKLGTLTRTSKTIITAQTNTVNCENFAPEK
jgi:hypothetical protein